MFIISGVIIIIFIILGLLSASEDSRNLFERISLYIYRIMKKKKYSVWGESQIRAIFVRSLVPQNVEISVKEYYVNKFKKMFSFLFVTMLLSLAIGVSDYKGSSINNNEIVRGTNYDEIGREYLEGVINNDKYTFELQVWSKEFTDKEIEEYFNAFKNQIEELVSGENTSLDNVMYDLNLTDRYNGFPFEVRWESDKENIVNERGEVYVEKKEEVKLTANISYEPLDFQEKLSLWITAQPFVNATDSIVQKEIENALINVEENTRQSSSFRLPDTYKGDTIIWKNKVKKDLYILPLLGLVVTVAVYFLEDGDLKKASKQKQKAMKKEYPNVVYKLLLYISAGMTVRGAFFRIARENNCNYTKLEDGTSVNKKAMNLNVNNRQLIYEEIVYMCRQLENGVSEAKAYETFGQRIGTAEYIRLGSILSQNLKKGNQFLEERLSDEAMKAYEKEIIHSRKLGEKAATKLLLPMILMLFVVMIIIILPAFWGIAI